MNPTRYSEWLQQAERQDAETGADRWREDPETPELASDLIRRDIAKIRQLRQDNELPKLARALHESIYRHQGDIVAPHLYAVAKSGTKKIIGEYLDEIEAGLMAFAENDHPKLDRAARREVLQDAVTNLGRPALMLSGGAAMGFFHLGVIKALFDEGLLPDVICGASIGSMVGGGVCARNDDELAELFENLDSIYRFGIRFLNPSMMWKQKTVLDQKQIQRCIEENVGPATFREAAEHSGRTLCISVSPARARQKPRVLSATTAPDVLIASAAVASSAIPGLFPPVMLHMRISDNRVVPYLPAERWVDGSFQGDLPGKRLGRLFNVNHFIVSQVNPHVIPFLVSRGGSGVRSLLADLVISTARVQTGQVMKVLQARIKGDRLHNVIEHLRLMAEQDYRGDTNIHPPLSGWMYRKLISNPSVEDLQRYIRTGEQATWPKIELIRNQTRIQRDLRRALDRLED